MGAGLAAETVTNTYDTTGCPLTTAGIDSYISATSYYNWGPAYQRILGTGTKRICATETIDETTGRLTAATPTPRTRPLQTLGSRRSPKSTPTTPRKRQIHPRDLRRDDGIQPVLQIRLRCVKDLGQILWFGLRREAALVVGERLGWSAVAEG